MLVGNKSRVSMGKREVICITIQEIDLEIRRLEALKIQKEKEELPEHQQYIGKFYKSTEGSIGKIIDVYCQDDELRIRGKDLWFDDEDYSLVNEECVFKYCDFEIITEDIFRTIFDGWTKRILLTYGIKEDIFDRKEIPQRFRTRLEYANQDMTQEEIKKYQMEHPVYYPRTPSLDTKCPVRYDYLNCSFNEHGMRCRTCVNYNPLRMLYEKELKPGIALGVPLQVLLADAKIQLKHGN